MFSVTELKIQLIFNAISIEAIDFLHNPHPTPHPQGGRGGAHHTGGGTVDQGPQIDPLTFHWFFNGRLMVFKGFLEQLYEVSVMHKAFMY